MYDVVKKFMFAISSDFLFVIVMHMHAQGTL